MQKVVLVEHVFKDVDKMREVFDGSFDFVECNCATPREALKATTDADAIIVVNFSLLTREIIENASKCKVISRCGIGLDNVDIEAANDMGIVVTNVPDYCLDEVSDHAMSLLLALERNIVYMNTKLHSDGSYKPDDLGKVRNIRGKTAGIVGFGRIGKLTAAKLNAFGANVLFYDPYVKTGKDAKSVSFDELIENSDYIIIHAPLTDDNYHLFNDDAFGKMKRKPYIVNVGRGAIIDTEALGRAVRAGKVLGAGLDVVEDAPPYIRDSLMGLDRIIYSPHAAWYSDDAIVKLQQRAAQNVLEILSGKKSDYIVNKEVLETPQLRQKFMNGSD